MPIREESNILCVCVNIIYSQMLFSDYVTYVRVSIFCLKIVQHIRDFQCRSSKN